MAGYDPTHFYEIDGALYPQPWMQKRRVATAKEPGKAGSYGTSGGSNKNDLLQSVTTEWKNETPLPAYVYGEVTRGGCKVTLQARSRGYVADFHGVAIGEGAITLVEASRMGVGLDIGRGGILGQNTDFGILERRCYSSTMFLCPEITGWNLVVPEETIYARVDTKFVSQLWEGTDPDGGAAGSESVYESGDIRLDLYAVPVIA